MSRAGATTGTAAGATAAGTAGRGDLLVAGESRMADAVAARASRDGPVRRDLDPRHSPPAAMVVASDGWAGPTIDRDVRALADRWGVTWFPLEVIAGTALIGPAVVPGRPGCDRCATARRRAAGRSTAAWAALEEAHGGALQQPGTAHLGAFGAPVIAEIAAGEAGRIVAGEEPQITGAVVHVRLGDLATSRHRFLAYPHCPICAALPDDVAEAAAPPPDHDRKLASDTYRTRDLRDAAAELLQTYVDGESGLVRQIEKTTSAAYPYAAAMMVTPTMDENGFGRALDFQTCIVGAVAEALERLGGARPGGRRTVVHGSYRELADRAVDPRRLGLYPPDAPVPSPFTPYRPDEPLDWVWGWSYTEQNPVLLPETYVYYRRHHFEPATPALVRETSNGCAVGGCLSEAVLHGLLELVERDSFLMTWYARLPLPELDLATAADPALRLMIERLEHLHGFELRAFDATMEHGIPAVWVMAIHPEPAPRHPKAFCASGAAFDPQEALMDALLELAVVVPRQSRIYDEDLDRVARMVDDPREVRDIDDHALLYCHPRAFERFDFLLTRASRTGRRSLGTSFAGCLRPRAAEISADLQVVVERFASVGLEVIAVDQTTPEMEALGLRCARAVVPGMLPLSFGHAHRRVATVPRLAEVPRRLGYRDGALPPEQVNPHPHPYP